MSIESRSWAWSLEHLRPAAKLTLLVLADLADAEGKASCPWKYLTRLTCQSEGTVKRVLKELEYYGLVERAARFADDGGQLENSFRLCLEVTKEKLAEQIEAERHGGMAYIYVLSKGNLSKIGMSRSGGASRLDAIKLAAPGEQIYLNWQAAVPSALVRKIERAAHAALDEHAVSLEWFMVTPEFAIEIVQTEMAKFGLRG